MSAKFASVDFRLTPEGRKVLEDAKTKVKAEKVEGTGGWPPERGPTICGICCGWCCGPNPYKGGKGKHEGGEYKEDLEMLDLKKPGSVTKVNSSVCLLF